MDKLIEKNINTLVTSKNMTILVLISTRIFTIVSRASTTTVKILYFKHY